MLHPQWTLDFVKSEPILFANVSGTGGKDGTDAVGLADYVTTQLDPSLSWDDIEWFRSIWDGPIVIKGVQDVQDVDVAAKLGIDAVALSNHGGRQLDDAPSPIELVPEAVEIADSRTQILCDGGIRRGADIVKALCLGATACMVGRAYLYGLGAAGERGVDKALGFLTSEVERTMALIGANSVTELGPDYLTTR